MATVTQMLDRLTSGRATLDEVAADFAQRSWPKRPPLTEAQRHGVDDIDPPDENSWAAVHADSRLSPEEYETLFNAMQKARQ
jgi:hypothetical protein